MSLLPCIRSSKFRRSGLVVCWLHRHHLRIIDGNICHSIVGCCLLFFLSLSPPFAYNIMPTCRDNASYIARATDDSRVVVVVVEVFLGRTALKRVCLCVKFKCSCAGSLGSLGGASGGRQQFDTLAYIFLLRRRVLYKIEILCTCG